jgi:uncharacterized protein (DUF362 family)
MTKIRKGSGLSRGEFLKITTLTLTALFIKACSKLGVNLPTETPEGGSLEVSPSPTTQPGDEDMAQVAFVKTEDRTQGVQQAIDLLGINPVEGKHVFLKPNFNSADPAPGSTHPDVLRAMVSKLWEMGATKITLGDRSGMGNTRAVMEDIGVFSLARELGFEVIVFDELGAEDWELFITPDSHWKLGFPFALPPLNADVIVQACCLKTHKFGGHFTMSLKNSVGMVAKTVPGQTHNYMTELHTSTRQREMIAEINAAYQPGLIVMDGVEAFTKGGPAEGTRVDSQVVLASTDRIALDAVGVALLRYYGTTSNVARGKIFGQAQIARAVELGLGVDHPEKIEIITTNTASAAYAEEIRAVLIS